MSCRCLPCCLRTVQPHKELVFSSGLIRPEHEAMNSPQLHDLHPQQDPSGLSARRTLQPLVDEAGRLLRQADSPTQEASNLSNPLGQHATYLPLLVTPRAAFAGRSSLRSSLMAGHGHNGLKTWGLSLEGDTPVCHACWLR